MKYFLSLALYLFSFSLFSQPLTFQLTLGNRTSEANSMLKIAHGHFVVSGTSWNHINSDSDLFLCELDSIGNVIWKKNYGGLNYEYGTGLSMTLDGGYILAGQAFNFNTFQTEAIIIKTDSAGNVLFTKSYMGSAKKVLPTADGGYIIAGMNSNVGAGNYDFYLVKTNGQGTSIWNKTYGGFSTEILYDLQKTSNGGYLLTGATNSTTYGDYDGIIIQTDSLGNIAWQNTYGDTSDNWFTSLTPISGGKYIVTGRQKLYDSLGTTSTVAGTLGEIDDTGNLLWERAYRLGSKTELNKAITNTINGGYTICGYKKDVDTLQSDALLIRTDSSGQVIWANTYGGNFDESFNDLTKTSDTGIAIAGSAKSFNITTINNVYLVKTNQIGKSHCYDTIVSVSDSLLIPFISPFTASIDTGFTSIIESILQDTLGILQIVCTSYIPPASVEGLETSIHFQLYPNPNDGNFIVETTKAVFFMVYDLTGKMICNKNILDGKNEISLLNASNGLYIYEAKDNKNNIISRGKLLLIQ